MAASTGCGHKVEEIVRDKCPANGLAFPDLEANEKPAILGVLSNLLNQVVARNDAHLMQTKRGMTPFTVTVFHGLRAPSISIDKYLDRIFKYANCSTSCFIVAYVYIDRFVYQQPGVPITSFNVHRLLITSVMVAAKFLDDIFYNNAFYAKIGGVSIYEMNRMELEFLFRLHFKLHVTVPAFYGYCADLAKEVAICPPYLLEKVMHLGCGLGEASLETKPEQQVMAARCSYAAF